MKEVTENDIFDNYTFWNRASKLCKIKKPVTLNYISSLLKEGRTGENFIGTLKYLEHNKFIVVDRTRVPHLYTIKGKELAYELLEKGEISKQIESLVKIKNLGMYSY